jgi:hypothetical protein
MTLEQNASLQQWREKYRDLNLASLRWLLARPELPGGWLNTKLHSITLRDYDASDGARAPEITYGWIQGRGLEALVNHAAFARESDPNLAAMAEQRARGLYDALAQLYERYGTGYFLYDANLYPTYFDADGQKQTQYSGLNFATFSEVFMLKGLISGAAAYDAPRLQQWCRYLDRVVERIETGRFFQNERQKLTEAALAAEAENYGPRMILTGAAAMLRRLGLKAEFGDRFIDHVLARHTDRGSGLLLDTPGEDLCNPGHAIEFFGFALDFVAADDPRVPRLLDGLLRHCDAGFHGPGVAIAISVSSGDVLEPFFPWWTLPETIRASALAYEKSGDPRFLDVWERADTAFWTGYLHPDMPVAVQNRDWTGPVDRVPATPDLDPLYHTALSLLGAIGAVDRLSR